MTADWQDDPRQRRRLVSRLVNMRRWIVPVVYLLSGVAFIVDLTRTNSFAYGIVYAPLVATGVFHGSRRATWLLALVAAFMVAIGAFLPFIDPDLHDLIANRILSMMAVIATALFVDYALAIQDRLAAQTRRAAAAERVKTEVFTNLSQEMRGPLQSLVGLMSLLKAGARSDQAEAMDRIDGGARQLLATIDNLIELTQIDERRLVTQAIDLDAVAREAACQAATSAREYAVHIAIPPTTPNAAPTLPADRPIALGDPWAVRRILDNLISYLIRLAEPGETVSVSVGRNGRDVVASVSGPVAAQLADTIGEPLGEEAADRMGMEGAAGMALSQRLASRMNGRLLIVNAANDAAIVRLSLPAA